MNEKMPVQNEAEKKSKHYKKDELYEYDIPALSNLRKSFAAESQGKNRIDVFDKRLTHMLEHPEAYEVTLDFLKEMLATDYVFDRFLARAYLAESESVSEEVPPLYRALRYYLSTLIDKPANDEILKQQMALRGEPAFEDHSTQ